MPSGKHHQAISKERTGNYYATLHTWIDDNKDDISVDHRSKNHYYTKELRQYVYDNFGGNEAVSEWLFHIALDNLDTSVTNDRMHKELPNNNYFRFGFTDNNFIYCDEEELSEEDLEDEFEDDS